MFIKLLSIFSLVLLSSAVFAQPVVETTLATPAFPEKPAWAGDLRYRLAQARENVDQARPYHQLRARLGLKERVQEDVTIQVRLMTGTMALSPNQTLGDSKDPGMPRRYVGLDLAFAEWNLREAGRVWIGRSSNPFFAPAQSQMIFDSDLAFEGFSYKWEMKGESKTFFANLGTFMISENYTAGSPGQDAPDTGLVGLQGGVKSDVAGGTLTVHVGSQHFVNIQDRVITVTDKDAKIDTASAPFERFKGNIVSAEDPSAAPAARKYLFRDQFIIYESGIELKVAVASVDLSLFGYYAKNAGASEANQASEGGIILGTGRFILLVSHVEKDADAVVGAFTDSDYNGGGTDSRGEKIALNAKLGASSNLVVTGFAGKRGIGSTPRSYQATQVDFSVSF